MSLNIYSISVYTSMQIVTNGMEFTVTLASGVTFNAKGAQSTAIDKTSHKVFTKAAKSS